MEVFTGVLAKHKGASCRVKAIAAAAEIAIRAGDV